MNLTNYLEIMQPVYNNIKETLYSQYSYLNEVQDFNIYANIITIIMLLYIYNIIVNRCSSKIIRDTKYNDNDIILKINAMQNDIKTIMQRTRKIKKAVAAKILDNDMPSSDTDEDDTKEDRENREDILKVKNGKPCQWVNRIMDELQSDQSEEYNTTVLLKFTYVLLKSTPYDTFLVYTADQKSMCVYLRTQLADDRLKICNKEWQKSFIDYINKYIMPIALRKEPEIYL